MQEALLKINSQCITANQPLRTKVAPSLLLQDYQNLLSYSKHDIAFFVDRDLSEFLDEPLPQNTNMYITDKYSIENDIVNRGTCERVLTELFNIESIDISEAGKILDLFDEQLGSPAEVVIFNPPPLMGGVRGGC